MIVREIFIENLFLLALITTITIQLCGHRIVPSPAARLKYKSTTLGALGGAELVREVGLEKRIG